MTLYFIDDLTLAPDDRDVLFLLKIHYGGHQIVQGNRNTQVVHFELKPSQIYSVVGWCEVPSYSIGNSVNDYKKTITWNWEDVQDLHKELSREQCIQVLDHIWDNLDSTKGVDDNLIRYVVEDLFGSELYRTDYSWVTVKDYKTVDGVEEAVYVYDPYTSRYTIYYRDSKPGFNYCNEKTVIETIQKYKKLKDKMERFCNS